MTFLRRLPGTLACLAFSLFALFLTGPQVQYALSGHGWGWIVVVLCIAAFFGGLWGAVRVAAGRNPLGARRPEDRGRVPRRLLGARIALGFAALMSAYMLINLPIPSTDPAEVKSALVLGTVCVASLVAMATLSRRSPVGRRLTLVIGALALLHLSRAVWNLWGVAHDDVGPGVVWSVILAGSTFVALVVAALVVLSVRPGWPAAADLDVSATT